MTKTVCLFVLFVTTICGCKEKPSSLYLPTPTEEIEIKEGQEEEKNKVKKERWLAALHKTAPEQDWRAIEAKTAFERHELKVKNGQHIAFSRSGTEVLADGKLTGEWLERGSVNQAGRVLATQYRAESEEIYLISAGGSVWRGAIDGSNWQVVNQDLRFNTRFLKFIDGPGGPRLISTINKIPYYSDDLGQSWSASTGLDTYDNWGSRRNHLAVDDSEQTIFTLVQEWLPGPWRQDVGVYYSVDQGASYSRVLQLGDVSINDYALVNPHHSSEVFMIQASSPQMTSIYQFDHAVDSFKVVSQNSTVVFDNERANLTATFHNGNYVFYAYDDAQELYRSSDLGNTWSAQGPLRNDPWDVGLWVSPSNPDFLLYGNIECYKSPDAGQNWIKQNSWGSYYNDVPNKLHADIMFFNEFEDANDQSFILISNDGGLSISYDYLDSTPNIGLTGLNVSQYYDVRTDPLSPFLVYGGTQDQGFQRAFSFSNESPLSFDQVISGDYGHIVFSEAGQRMWTVYPGGWVTYYDDPGQGNVHDSWEVDSEDETVWIPPLMESPISSENRIYMAGGNAFGGYGSHIISLTYDQGGIQVDQNPFDFKAESGGEISAMAVSPTNSLRWYVATTNGLFYTSNDNGSSWDVSVQVGPEPQYLYGSTIYPSRLDVDAVYFGGSGYSTFPVYKSTNGGQNFVQISEGLPPTVVIELTANEDESMLYAATEAGPYVYVVEDEMWYSMLGDDAPSQTYWSVEFLAESQIVRFGTYGRGIWDFRIDESTGIKSNPFNQTTWTVYPNPVTDFFKVRMENQNVFGIKVYDANGRLMFIDAAYDFQKIITNNWPKGVYTATISMDGQYDSQLILVQ